MKKLYKIDIDGYLIFGEDLYIDSTIDNNGNEFYDIPEGYTDTHYEGGFFKPRLVNGEWVEVKTDAEFAEEKALRELSPTKEEIEQADFTLKGLNLLAEVGLL